MTKMPKSAAIGLLASAMGLFLAAPLMFFGPQLWSSAGPIGFPLFWACCIIAAVAFAYHQANLVRGRYVSLQARPWRQQVW